MNFQLCEAALSLHSKINCDVVKTCEGSFVIRFIWSRMLDGHMYEDVVSSNGNKFVAIVPPDDCTCGDGEIMAPQSTVLAVAVN